MEAEGKKQLFVREGTILYRLDPTDIKWIEVEGNYLYIITESKRFTLRISLRKLEQKLPAHQFIKIHRSVIVRFGAIDKVDFSAGVVFVGEKDLPLGPTYKEKLLTTLELLN
ncbi:MAG: LytTR family DNA-binding domain-containing protein [Bacteroidota bacterium]